MKAKYAKTRSTARICLIQVDKNRFTPPNRKRYTAMKRMLLLLVAAALVFCLSGCDTEALLGKDLDTDEAMPHYQVK